MHFLQTVNSDLSVLIVCNKTGGTIKGDIKKIRLRYVIHSRLSAFCNLRNYLHVRKWLWREAVLWGKHSAILTQLFQSHFTNVLLEFICRPHKLGAHQFQGKIKLYIYTSSFVDLEVACWPLVPKFAGSNPTEAVGFLRVTKNPQQVGGHGC